MKKIIFFVLSLFTLSVLAFSQSPPPPDYSLSVDKQGVGDTVTITIESATVNSTNQYPIFVGFSEPAMVTLTANDHEYSDGARDVFVRWEGDLTGNENPATLYIDGQKTVTALYVHGDPTPTTIPTPAPTPFPTPISGTGDVNTDGSIDIIDAYLIAQYYAGLNPLNFQESNADVDCNGTIDIIDALIVAQYYVGLITLFPECQQILTVEVEGKDPALPNCDGIPRIAPPGENITGATRFSYNQGTEVHVFILGSTPPPPGTPWQSASFEFEGETGNEFYIEMDTDKTVKVIFTTYLNPTPVP
ncbi:MAG: dockerin type I repeat-containing protein [Spirochaetales bacterium]|nr:dockerin type I repeat-containing protein [Spirochaetales bacterium]